MAEEFLETESYWNIKAALSLMSILLSYKNNEILREKLKDEDNWVINEVLNEINNERLGEFCKNTKIEVETKIFRAIDSIGLEFYDTNWYKRSFHQYAETKIEEFEKHVDGKSIVITEMKSYFNPKQYLGTKWGHYLLISIFSDFSKEAYFYKNGKWISLIPKGFKSKLTANKEFKLVYLKVSEEDLNILRENGANLENEVKIHLENPKQEEITKTHNADEEYFKNTNHNIKTWGIKPISSNYSPAETNHSDKIIESQKEIQKKEEMLKNEKEENQKLKVKIENLQKENEELKIEKEKAEKFADEVKKKENEELNIEKAKAEKLEDEIKKIAAILEKKEKELEEKDKKIMKMKEKKMQRELLIPPQPPQPPEPIVDYGPFKIFNEKKLGLPNLINTCYFNAVLQALASNNRFVNYVNSIESHPFATTLYGVFSIMRGNIEEALRMFKDQVNQEFPFLDSFGQQDSKEFLVSLLSKLEEISNVSLSNIKLIQEFSCMKCRNNWQSEENQSFFVIPSDKKNKISTHLKDLKAKVQLFRGDNMLYCQFCDSQSNMSITIKKIVCSEMLIFYLPNNGNFSNAKLEEYLKVEEYEFSLYAVICYYGSGNSGHYTAFTKDGNTWRLYNDEQVSDKVYNAANSYLAFYLLNKPRS